MTPEQWARVKEVFNAALAQDASSRAAFVAEETAGDEPVRIEVERLLDADRQSGDFIERPAVATLLSGRVISHYEIGHLVGSGGMGRVYAARDTELGREVAIKVASVGSEDAQARLRREAQHASRLSHPHVCHIYDVGRVEGQVFVVMELVEGRPLADVLREGPLSIESARRYGSEIADALAHAHERGVTHRDLKSTNVMITKRGAKVLDFGLARMLDTHQLDALSQSRHSLTGEGLIAGTLPYMAPELLRGERGDQRADIWALGVLLYEMVGGRRPFTGRTGFELSAAILHQPPAPLPDTVPGPLDGIIRRCLAKDAGDRYQHAADVHAALDEMNGPAPASRPRAVPVPSRLAVGLLLLAIAVPIVVIITAPMRSGLATASRAMFSNARGYELLEAGEFARAVEEFRGLAEPGVTEANPWDSLGEGLLASGMPDESLEAYSQALTIDPTYAASLLGRALALAALGRYDEALNKDVPDRRIHAFLLSRVGRYAEAAKVLESMSSEDAEATASARLVSAWLLIERKQYARALEELRAAEKRLADDPDHRLMVFGDVLWGLAEIGAGNMANAATRLGSQKIRFDSDDDAQANWVAGLEGEIALAQRDYDGAVSRFSAADQPVWVTLGGDTLGVFVTNSPSRDGRARVEMARGNRRAAIEEYRRLTAIGVLNRPAPVVEPRYVLALARLLEQEGNADAARTEYARFLTLWAKADPGLPELDEARRALARLAPKPVPTG